MSNSIPTSLRKKKSNLSKNLVHEEGGYGPLFLGQPHDDFSVTNTNNIFYKANTFYNGYFRI